MLSFLYDITLIGGTSNGLVKSVLYQSNVEYSLINSVFVSLKGKSFPLDLSLVQTKSCFTSDTVSSVKPPLRSFLSLGWGMISDVDILSEFMRPIGELRIYVAAFYFILLNRTYRGRLSILLADEFNSISNSSNPTEVYLSKESNQSNGVGTGILKASTDLMGTSIDSSHIVLSSFDMPVNYVSNDVESTVNTDQNWLTIESEFSLIWVLQTSHCASTIHSGPGVKLNDGILTIIVAEKMKRIEALDLLIGMDEGKHFNNPKIKVYKAKAYRLEPLTDKGILSLDGEVIEYGPIQASVQPSAARVLAL